MPRYIGLAATKHLVELYPTRKTRVCKHNIATTKPIDSRENQAVQASVAKRNIEFL